MSSALITRSIEDVGATMFASAGRRGATMGFTALKENAAWISPLLAVQSGFEKWDVRDALKLAGVEVAEAKANAQVSILKFGIFASSLVHLSVSRKNLIWHSA